MSAPSSATRALIFFAFLTVAHTWPLASAPHRLSLNHNADAQLNAWIVTWIAHVLPTHPTQFWQGNIFQPGERALSFSEPLVVPALAGAPIFWLSGSAVLTFNLLLLVGLTMTAWTTWWVVTRWTDSPGAGVLAGALVTFNAHLLTRLPHLQAAHAWGLLLVWGAAWSLLYRQDDRARWWWLAGAVALVAATSLHWLVFAVIGVGLMVVTNWPSRDRLMTVIAGGVAGVIGALPLLWPHLTGGVRRPLEQVADFSATPGGYLSSMSWLHRGWSTSAATVETNLWFPGVVCLALATIGLIVGWRTSRLTRWAIALVLCGFVLSLGTMTPVYEWVYRLFPPVQGIRAASRFGMLALVGLALLAALAVAWLERRLRPRAARVLIVVSITLATVEAIHSPIHTTPFSGVPAVYSLLRDEPGPVLLAEMPFYPPDAVFENGEYVLNATAHWRPVMNGYSGVTPMSYRRHAETLWYFPQARAFPTLQEAGVTHVMVHLEKFGAEATDVARSLDGRQDLRLMAADRDGHRLYRLVRE
ncbi:MAG: hypothetical protein IT185_01215 [Acidobacteria bacterium]|nr:hypothetical protein [Acidobacteriota bacterium]